MLKRFLLCFSLITTLLQAEQKVDNKNVWVTIFIHGSFSLRPHLSISNILNMLNDSIEETVYYRSTEINRRDPFFYKNQAMGEIGLHKIDLNRPTTMMAAPTVALAFEEISQTAGYPSSDQYYTFGWSGLVSNKLRYIEANFLYKELAKLIKQLRADEYNPKIRIIGYSHGGNIGLQLGALHQTKNPQDQINIDEFHLLGTPIQLETDYLINSPVFKRVFNWYSRADSVQALDFFSFKRWFSHKKFSKRKNFTLPDKLTQIRIKVSDFTPRKMKKQLDRPPKDKREIKKYFKEFNYDPGHFELWFMGWTILTYRKTFPTNPLPIIIFIPMITRYLEQNPNATRDLVAHIQPYFNKVELYPYRSKHRKYYYEEKPFIPQEQLKTMQEYARKFTPDNYNIKTYNRKVYDAIKVVDHELTKIKKLTKLEQKKVAQVDPIINLHKSENIYQGHLPSRNK